MATTKTTTNASKPKTAARKRKPAAKPSAQSATTSSTRPSSRVAQVGQLAERAVRIPVGVALEARDRVVDLVATTRAQARRNLGSNVEAVSSRVETVVQNGVNAGIKLVNGAQDRISRVS
jgi:hypothetical protein